MFIKTLVAIFVVLISLLVVVLTVPLPVALRHFPESLPADSVESAGGTLLDGNLRLTGLPGLSEDSLVRRLELFPAEMSWRYCPSLQHGLLTLCLTASSLYFSASGMATVHLSGSIELRGVNAHLRVRNLPIVWEGNTYPISLSANVVANIDSMLYDFRQRLPYSLEGWAHSTDLTLGLYAFQKVRIQSKSAARDQEEVVVSLAADGTLLEVSGLVNVFPDGQYRCRIQLKPELDSLKGYLANIGRLEGDTVHIEKSGKI